MWRCTHLGGALFLTQKFVARNILSLLQILVLSSNTKKGATENAYFVSLMFCVLDNNIKNFKCVLSGAGFSAQEFWLSPWVGVTQYWGRIIRPGGQASQRH
jgi:hypothetical protein